MDHDASPPDFDEWESPDSVFTDVPIRERLLDVVVQVREPTRVAAIADRADCDTETARDYLEWFASAGIVREHEGRPVRYERNESYLRWRRIEELRQQYSETELVDELETAVAEVREYRERFGADDPDDVSLLTVDEADGEGGIEAVWEDLSQWKTVQRRAELLDAARRDEFAGGRQGRIDA